MRDYQKKDERNRREYREKVKADPSLQNKQPDRTGQGMVWASTFMRDCIRDLPNRLTEIVDSMRPGIKLEVDLHDYDTMPARLADEYIKAAQEWIRVHEHRLSTLEKGSREFEKECGESSTPYTNSIELVRGQVAQLTPEQQQTERVYVETDWWTDLGFSKEEAYGCWCPRSLIQSPPIPAPWQLGNEWLNASQSTRILERSYALLAAIHDQYLPDTTRLITAGVWSDDVKSSITITLLDRREYGLDEAFVTDALERVKNDLPKEKTQSDAELVTGLGHLAQKVDKLIEIKQPPEHLKSSESNRAPWDPKAEGFISNTGASQVQRNLALTMR